MSIFAGVGSSSSVGPTSGGKVYAFNNISESGLVIVAPGDVSRQRIAFHNPGPSDIFIAPALVQTTGSSVAFSPSNAALGGCIRVYGNGGSWEVSGECQGAWQAFAITGAGTTNSLTVVDSNV